jgi:hypothetical protein
VSGFGNASGGLGVKSGVTGTAVGRAGGGGGGGFSAAGNDGGGAGVTGGTPNNGVANTGGGGGGGPATGSFSGGNGGSGVVIIRVAKDLPLKTGPSHVFSKSVVGQNDVYVFTAGDDNITIG